MHIVHEHEKKRVRLGPAPNKLEPEVAVVGAAVDVFALAGVPPSVVPVGPKLPKRPPVAGFVPNDPPPGGYPLVVPVVPPLKSEGGMLEVPAVVPAPPLNKPPPVEVVLPPLPSPAVNEPNVDPDVPCVPVFC